MGPMPSVDYIGAPICSMVEELERDANRLSDVFRASLEDDVGTSKGFSQLSILFRSACTTSAAVAPTTAMISLPDVAF